MITISNKFQNIQSTDEAPSKIVPPIKNLLPMPEKIGEPRQIKIITHRLLRWVMCNVCFALLPLFSGLFISMLVEENIYEYNYIKEILFFVIMVNAISIYDLLSVDNMRKRFILPLFLYIFMILIIISATFYGFVTHDFLINYTEVSEKLILYVSLSMAAFSFISGTLLQVFINIRDKYIY